jgi:hypothetical protein
VVPRPAQVRGLRRLFGGRFFRSAFHISATRSREVPILSDSRQTTHGYPWNVGPWTPWCSRSSGTQSLRMTDASSAVRVLLRSAKHLFFAAKPPRARARLRPRHPRRCFQLRDFPRSSAALISAAGWQHRAADRRALETRRRGHWACFTLEPRLQPTLGDLLWSPNWILGSWFCRARCSFGYHNRIGNRFRNIDGF